MMSTNAEQPGRTNLRAAVIWTTVLSIVLGPFVVIGPFIAGYVGGRKAGTAPAALLAAFGPALLSVGLWWWLSAAGLPIGKTRIMPPVDLFAPTAGLAILGGAFAGSGGRLAHVVGAAILVVALGWIGSGGKQVYDVYRDIMQKPASGGQPTSAADKSCPDRLKKLYDATMLYAEAWDGTLPPADHWMSALRDPAQPFGEEEYLHCPDVSKGAGPKYGYAMNSELGGKRIKDVKDAAKTPLYFDSDNLSLDASAAAPPANGRHGGKSNVVFADGHAGQQ